MSLGILRAICRWNVIVHHHVHTPPGSTALHHSESAVLVFAAFAVFFERNNRTRVFQTLGLRHCLHRKGMASGMSHAMSPKSP